MTETCFVCKKQVDKWYTEWIYFRETGLKLCQKCFDKHCEWKDPKYHIHVCCQDFMDMNGNWAHYNLPIFVPDGEISP